MKKKSIFILAVSSLIFGNVFAVEKNGMPNISTNGGVTIGDSTGPYWFKLNGSLFFDQRLFLGNSIAKGNEFHSGGNIRQVELDFSGGLGKKINYYVATNYKAKTNTVELGDVYLAYLIKDGFSISAGKVSPAFSLLGASSAKWVPFLDKSLDSCLGTDSGLGINIGKFATSYTLGVSISQPTNNKANINDRLQVSTRLAYRPIYDGSKIFQVGASGYFRSENNAEKIYSSFSELTARNNTEILSTGTINSISNRKGVALELAGQHGPFYGEFEYRKEFVSRKGANQNYKFHGFHVLCSYVLTGESKAFNPASASFGQIKPDSDQGAWEVAARYSSLNLNNKDIFGGKAHNIGLSLSHYVNNNVRIVGEYIRGIQYPSKQVVLSNTTKRKLNALSLRLQAVF